MQRGEPEDRTDELFEKIVSGKNDMQKELNEAEKIIKFLNQFTLEKSPNTGKHSKSKSHDPMILLQTNDVEEFLLKTKEFFESKNLDFLCKDDKEKKLLEVTNSRLEANYEDLLLSIKVSDIKIKAVICFSN